MTLELLRRRSLVEWDAAAKRYSLHDLVRVFASGWLENVRMVQWRHAEYYANIASYAQNNLYLKGHVLSGLELFDIERTNIDTGWAWAMANAGHQDTDQLLLDYSDALSTIGYLRYNLRRERIPMLEVQLAAARRIKQPISERDALGNLGLVHQDLGNLHKAAEYYEKALVISREIGDIKSVGHCLGNIGNVYRERGFVHQAIDLYRQALVIYRQIGDKRAEAHVLGNLGNAYYDDLADKEAITSYRKLLRIVREVGDLQAEANALNGLGNVYREQGLMRKATSFHKQALAIYRQIGDQRGEALASWNLGLALEQQGDLVHAAEAMQTCVDYEHEIGHPDAEKDADRLEQLRQRLATETYDQEQQ